MSLSPSLSLSIKQVMLLIFSLLLVANLPAAQLPKDAQFKDWQVKCGRNANQGTNCFLLQTVSNKSNDKPILQAMVGFLPGNKEPSAIFTIANLLPLNTQLKLIFSDSFAISFKIKSCRKQSFVCIAVLKLDQKLLAQIGIGEVAYLSFTFAGKDRQVPISLVGLSSGLDAFKH